ncbi:multidrug efflux SMR transporter [Bacillus inaquosorum]|uniref:SMR family multidrug resistance protein n=1 Tax=Bacillus inaquosorum KCTC 13429 TaxID=1236548 RepID=A0A9W5LKZ3_9BACI|nr:multidrug efflux SMR transporter [Bacillus inaquosorum]RKQ25293.1 QacE family quaternary ammonium compound efflux SMR transporter [Bacillus subtilis]AWM18468.1 QacE family quaternary ammonium compound efflux SMR transporter [Bacillus inaquosorum]ELS62621.1 SMR family multidrug resistance protein [Bacillus inaquosorum KCTC 13429]MCY7901115.1 multidrug efflux SMR transporter [Bacillus inaquosorum]MCY7906790.1 multidrug efflux SMR transporter [Bacillus inaquosorum]
MNWVFLCLAILFEVAGTVSMKLSSGFTKLTPSVLLIFFYGGSLFFLTLTLKSFDVSVAYAVWSGMGIVLITVVGFLFFQENVSVMKLISIGLIIGGVVSLNLIDHGAQSEPIHKSGQYK